MINQVAEIKTQSPYNDFNGYRKNPQFLVSSLPKNDEDDNSNGKILTSIGISALILGFATLGLMRGSPKNITKKLEKLKTYLEKKVENTKNSKSLQHITCAYDYALNKVNSLILKSESINNFTSLKDAVAKYFMDKTSFTRKIQDGLTNLYQKASRATVKNSWANTTQSFNETFTQLSSINKTILSQKGNQIFEINGVKRSGKEWIEIIENSKTEILDILKANTNQTALQRREKEMMEASNNLDKLIRALFKNYKNPRLFRSFVADDFIIKYKEQMFNEMNQFRKLITITNSDKRKFSAELLQKAENLLLEEHPSIHKGLNVIRKGLKQEIADEDILRAIENISKAIVEEKGNIKPQKLQKVLNYLKQTKEILQEKQSGKIQEILAIYKEISPEKYNKILKELNSNVKKLDKTINIESTQYFEKIRDLQIGSAPTDTLSIIVPAGYIAYGLHDKKDKDQKISLLLKEGIPVLSAVGTSLFCMARLISGSKAMLVGLISGWVMGTAGVYADKLRKRYFPMTQTSVNTAQTQAKGV